MEEILAKLNSLINNPISELAIGLIILKILHKYLPKRERIINRGYKRGQWLRKKLINKTAKATKILKNKLKPKLGTKVINKLFSSLINTWNDYYQSFVSGLMNKPKPKLDRNHGVLKGGLNDRD